MQSLAGINGEFVSAGNIVNVTTPGTPGPPPAPPGIVLKINHINGNITSAPDLLSDNKIFGLDATTGKVLRFNLAPTTNATTGQPNMAKQTGTLDPSFQLQQPAAWSTPVAISVGRDVGPETDLATNTYPTTNELVLLVSTGHEIYVYNRRREPT